MTQTTVNLVGAGRVGQTLLGLLRVLPYYKIQDVVSARMVSAENAVLAVGAGRAVEYYSDMRAADLWIFAVPDTEIAGAAQAMADMFAQQEAAEPAPVAFHCSGFFASEQLSPLRALGWRLASAHPVLSFADPKTAMESFKGVQCGVEGDAAALTVVREFFHRMGAQTFDIHPERKSLYHAAAVISNNFTVVLQAVAQEAWASAGVPDDVARHLNATLLNATCKNVVARGPQDALTGPAARGDDAVVTQQGRDVAQWHPSAGEVYDLLSMMAKELKQKGTTRGR
ncbi:MAG: DUF2520 domain-containing protein [Roseobacter sp.]